MQLSPTSHELWARAISDLRQGLPVILTSATNALIVIAAETIGGDRLDDLRSLGSVVVAVTDRRAATLAARSYDGDLARIVVPRDVGADWIRALADPTLDLLNPMKGPFKAERDGDATLFRQALSMAKAARLLPAMVGVTIADGVQFAEQNNLTHVESAVVAALDGHQLEQAVAAHLPTYSSSDGKLHVFRSPDGLEEHCALVIGSPDRSKPVLTRLHSACLTGDLLGSLKCDCGSQLRAALNAMSAEGSGVLLYLNQEGRGIGLTNKLRAYALQDQGFDTVEANHRLGFEDDERDFRTGATILSGLGFKTVRLLTNNPRKVDMMRAQGIEVTERIPLAVGRNEVNAPYLRTKAAKSGHLL